MSSYERLARFPKKDHPHMEPTAQLTIGLPESTYHGLHALISWLDGFAASGKGNVPGSFELVMHFRELTAAIGKTNAEEKKACEHEWKDLGLGKRWCPKCDSHDQRP